MGQAMLLAGSLGLGHEMMARRCAEVLASRGWRTTTLDSMSLLGGGAAVAGDRLFHRLVAVPGLYDGLHFGHLRTGSALATAMDRLACARLVPALRARWDRDPVDLVLSVFATGGSAAAKLKAERPGLRTVVLCTDACVHRLWAADGTDLFLVTSAVAEASVRRFLPRATVAVVPPPVRAAFYDTPDRGAARREVEVPLDARCVLLIDSGWGFGPLAGSVASLAAAGVHVLAVAGRRTTLRQRFEALAARDARVHPFGFTDRVPALMAAADAVIALPGATTCSEARVVGRPLLLLDLMPGHGRDNLQHELELGDAWVCDATAAGVTAGALALLEHAGNRVVETPAADRSAADRPARDVPRFEPALVAALARIGVDLGPADVGATSEASPSLTEVATP